MRLINQHLTRLSCAASIGLFATAVLLPVRASALPVAGGVVIRNDGSGGYRIKLGPTSEQTCFLSGISGSFYGAPASDINTSYNLPAAHSVRAEAEVIEAKGFWYLVTVGGYGHGVGANAICIFATENRTETSWSDNAPSVSVPAKANRHCFLGSVWATSGFSNAWSRTPYISVTTGPNGDFLLGGYVYPETARGAKTYEFGGATMRCVDFATSSQWDFTLVGPPATTGISVNTTTLRDSYPHGNRVPVADVGCFLTAISGGLWYTYNYVEPGPVAGVVLSADTKVSKYWRMSASNGRGGTVRCFR